MSNSSVLVVDDEPDACQNLADVLEDIGYMVDTAVCGEDALDLVRRKAYDVAILDLRMPGMDGLALFGEIHKLTAKTIALLVTAFASDETSAKASEAGIWQVMSKPVDFVTFLPAVASAAKVSIDSAAC